MFKIGEFSRLSGVPAKSLRHYDALGLFRPIWVDPSSGYRHYSPTQLPELYRIIALKNLGIPLTDVAHLVDDGADLSSALERRRSELEAERAALEQRLAALDISFDSEGRSAHPDVVTRRLEPELVACIRTTLSPDEDLEDIFNELEAVVRDAGVRAARPPATVVHAEYGTGDRDLEAVVPISRPIPTTARVSIRRLPRALAAAVIHRGPYEGLARSRAVLGGWIAASRLRPAGPLRIIYLQFGADANLEIPGPFLTDSAKRFVTELQQPVSPHRPDEGPMSPD